MSSPAVCSCLGAALIVVLFACTKAQAPTTDVTPLPTGLPAVAAPEAVSAAVAAPFEVSAAVLPAPPTVTEAEVRGLLDLWLAAQNQGDFASYQMLYATKMTGVRAVGVIRRQFSRAGWMADRKRMFGKAMQVQAEQVQVAIAAGLAQVRFVQTFQSGSFRDKGPKVWLVAREFDAPRIVREEMLSSVVSTVQQATPPPAENLALAVRVGDSTWLAIDAAPPTGDVSPTLLQQSGAWTAGVALDWTGTRKPWKDRDIIVYGQTGEVCRGQAVEVAAIARALPHFGQVQDWTEGPEQQRPPASEIAAAVWDLGKGDAITAVRIRPYPTPGNRADCPKALFGRSAHLPSPVFLGRDATKAGQLRETALATMRGERFFAEIGRDYAREVQPPRALTWDQYQHAVAEVVSFEGPGIRLVVTHAQAGEACGGFGGEYLAIWTARPLPPDNYRLVLASDPKAGADAVPQAAVDVDGDGQFELVAPDRIWRMVGPNWQPVFSLRVPDYDCPC